MRTQTVKVDEPLEARVNALVARLPYASKSNIVRDALRRGLAEIARELDEKGKA